MVKQSSLGAFFNKAGANFSSQKPNTEKKESKKLDKEKVDDEKLSRESKRQIIESSDDSASSESESLPEEKPQKKNKKPEKKRTKLENELLSKNSLINFGKKKQHESAQTEQKPDVKDEKKQTTTVAKDQNKVAEGAESKIMLVKGDNGNMAVPFSALCEAFAKVEATTKRLEILEIVTDLFLEIMKCGPKQLTECVYLCVNRVAPEYESIELGIGESLLIKAIASATGRTPEKVKNDLKALGDLGKVAEANRGKQLTMGAPKPLTVSKVFQAFRDIATSTGAASMQKKVNSISRLLVSCKGNEAKYLIRLLEGKLRIGLAEQSVLAALAHSSILYHRGLNGKSAKKAIASEDGEFQEAAATIKSVFNELPDYDKIIPVLIKEEYKNLPDLCKLTPGIPVKPMLAHPTKAISEVLDRFEGIAFTCEYKYDGERAQVHHMDDGRCMVFSRNLENTSEKYFDIVKAAKTYAKSETKSFILDCEAVAWDREKECILPFQVLTTRKRKLGKEEDLKVQVCLFAFDLLYLNGESLLRESLEKRRELLYSSFDIRPGYFQYAISKDLDSIEDIQKFLDDSIEGNCEGLMVKTLQGEDSSYEPSKRSRNWLKVKKDYLAGIGDSLDLVVVGAYTGKGKRTGVYGGYLLACYDPDSETYQTICKIGTGFSEQDLENGKKELEQYIIPEPKSYYSFGESTKPDVWFEPARVWEVKAADLSISPVYKAAEGLADSNKGISLRFPRFIRVRDDKAPEDATTSNQVLDMYQSQKLNQQ
ncbi:ATP-dependent DNA ligase Cdc17 [Mycoemilia scoparia]|uniref:DNA ligase n=1 Tax=Mycoemilia scoparia TaxID=417184 RepID=A0A9W8DU65_9FUNG|nr:ATP-dependent DNA ligase Cdc17 [Mycoemilia scoparia]